MKVDDLFIKNWLQENLSEEKFSIATEFKIISRADKDGLKFDIEVYDKDKNVIQRFDNI